MAFAGLPVWQFDQHHQTTQMGRVPRLKRAAISP